MTGLIIFGTYFSKEMIDSSSSLSTLIAKYNIDLFKKLGFVQCSRLNVAYTGILVAPIKSINDIKNHSMNIDELSLDERLNALLMIQNLPSELRENLPAPGLFVIGDVMRTQPELRSPITERQLRVSVPPPRKHRKFETNFDGIECLMLPPSTKRNYLLNDSFNVR